MQAINTFSPARSAGTAALLSGVNPKNLILTLGAAVTIAQTGSAGEQAVALLVFALIAAIGPGVPVVIYVAMGERADRLLTDLRSWLARQNAAIMTVLCLVIAAKLIGDAVRGLTT